jgi:hypothetical protein
MEIVLHNNAEFVTQQYAKAFNTLDVGHIALLLHNSMKHTFNLSGVNDFSIQGSSKYLGYLHQTFSQLKNEKVSLNVEVRFIENKGAIIPCIVMQPPHRLAIIYPSPYKDYNKASVKELAMECELFLYLEIYEGLVHSVCSGNLFYNTNNIERKEVLMAEGYDDTVKFVENL